MKSLGWIIIDRETKERLHDAVFDSKHQAEIHIKAMGMTSRAVANEVFY